MKSKGISDITDVLNLTGFDDTSEIRDYEFIGVT